VVFATPDVRSTETLYMTAWTIPLFVAALAVAPAAVAQDQEPKPVPKGSLQLAVNGCLKGRVFTATAPREEEAPRQGPDVTGQHFRVAGKKDVMKLVKAHQGHFVEVVGIVKASALADNASGKRVGNTTIKVGPGPRSSDPIYRQSGMAGVDMAVMDLQSLRYLSDACPIPMR
jgi:hypothetical protein